MLPRKSKTYDAQKIYIPVLKALERANNKDKNKKEKNLLPLEYINYF